MFVLITYDVNITSVNGAKRLRNVARVCKDYGKRVQNSVFECLLTEAQLVVLKNQLNKIIDKKVMLVTSPEKEVGKSKSWK